MKIKLSKKQIAIIVASALGVTSSGVAFHLMRKSDLKKEENKIGYENINPIINFKVDMEDFVILDIGNHDSIGVHFQNAKMKCCNDNDISLGVIISTDSLDEDGIYNDVEYVKGVLSNYEINFPVYLNIDNIITNDDLNVEMKTKLIKDFLTKCSTNNIYVGMYGTDTNLCRVKKYCNISSYDSFLVMDDDKVKYTGDYNVYKDLDGNIKSSINLEEVITSKELNDSSKFVSDGAYVFGCDDDLTDVALKYGMSVNELLDFNEISKDDVIEGTILRIPMIIGKVVPNGSGEYKRMDTPLRGCDISYAQGKSPNWDKLRENFDFIILKCSQGLSIDSYFDINALNCNTNNIPMGVYCYNGFDIRNCEDLSEFVKNQRKQAEFTLENLNNKKIDYPVYIDIEGGNLDKNLPKNYVKKMLKIWKNHIDAAGYIPGIYCNQSDFLYLQSCVDYDLSDCFEIWVAGGNQYKNEKTDKIELEEVVPSDVLEKDYGATIAQSTNVAINAGAYDSRGHLDINFSLVDYTQELVNSDSDSIYNFDIKEFERYDYSLIGGSVFCGLALVGGSFIAVKKRKKGKRKLYIK